MLTCKEASLLASKKLDKKLTIKESLNFALHLAMCTLCRHYANEIEAVHRVIQGMGKKDATSLTEHIHLSSQAHKRIKQEMDKALNSAKQ